MANVNWLSMILATMTPVVIGSIYYHRSLFGKAWANSLAVPVGKLKGSNRVVILVAGTALSFLLSFFLLNFNNSGIGQEGQFDTFKHGAWHGAFVAVTIVTPVLLINAYFGKRNWKNILINWIYWIITLALMGGILDAMNHWENIVIPE